MPSFLAPLFLIGAAAAAIPLVLHLLKREPESRVKFAAVKLLKHAPVEHTEKRHLRELLLLAMRIAALVLLALAFARPFMSAGATAGSAGVSVIALDTSYSLDAPGRFDRARQLAKNALGRVPANDHAGVVVFADAADIVAKPGTDRVLAAAAIDRATAGFGATRYRGALAAATQALAGRRGTIVVVTDLQENGWDAGDRASVTEGVTIEVVDVGELPPNLAVTALHLRPDRVVATVHNGGDRPREARVHLTLDSRPAGEATVTVAPRQSAEATLAGAPRGTVAAVSVDDPDGMQADNVRYAVLGSTSRPSVLVVTGSGDLAREGFYVQQAIVTGTQYQVAGASAAQLSSWSEDRLAGQAAVFVLSTRGLERRGRELLGAYAHAGGGLLIAAGPGLDGAVIADVLGAGSTLRIPPLDGARPAGRSLAPADARHPVFQSFAGGAATLGLVTFQLAARVGGTGCQTLARFTTGDAALIDCPAGEGRALVLASDLDNVWNDFPLHASFVPFLHEAARYLASGRAHAAEYVVGDVPAGVKNAPGVATVTDASGRSRRIAVNVDPREAEPARMAAAEFQSAVARVKDSAVTEARVEARQQEERQHLWQYVMAALAVMLVVEGFVASRTA